MKLVKETSHHFAEMNLIKVKKKPSCADCDSICAYTMEDLLDPQHGIGLEDLKLESLSS